MAKDFDSSGDMIPDTGCDVSKDTGVDNGGDLASDAGVDLNAGDAKGGFAKAYDVPPPPPPISAEIQVIDQDNGPFAGQPIGQDSEPFGGQYGTREELEERMQQMNESVEGIAEGIAEAEQRRREAEELLEQNNTAWEEAAAQGIDPVLTPEQVAEQTAQQQGFTIVSSEGEQAADTSSDETDKQETT